IAGPVSPLPRRGPGEVEHRLGLFPIHAETVQHGANISQFHTDRAGFDLVDLPLGAPEHRGHILLRHTGPVTRVPEFVTELLPTGRDSAGHQRTPTSKRSPNHERTVHTNARRTYTTASPRKPSSKRGDNPHTPAEVARTVGVRRPLIGYRAVALAPRRRTTIE